MDKQKSVQFPSSLWEDNLALIDSCDAKLIYLYIFTNTDRGIYRPNRTIWKRIAKTKMTELGFLEEVNRHAQLIVELPNGNWLLPDFLARTHKPGICMGKKPCNFCKSALKLYISNNVSFTDLRGLDNIMYVDIEAYVGGEIRQLIKNPQNTVKSKRGTITKDSPKLKERLRVVIHHSEHIEVYYTFLETEACSQIQSFLHDINQDWETIFKYCKVKGVEQQQKFLQDFVDYVIASASNIQTTMGTYIMHWSKKWHKEKTDQIAENMPSLAMNERVYPQRRFNKKSSD